MSDTLPRESTGDRLHLLARMGISSIPGLGGPALELFNALIAPPMQRRRDCWLAELEERLAKLEQQGRLNLDDLGRSDEFISTVMQASMIAIRNHRREKLEALRNAVVYVACGNSVEDSRRELFLSFVDVLTGWHLKVLEGFWRRDQRDKPHCRVLTGVTEIVNFAYDVLPELRIDQPLTELVVEELCRKGLLTWSQHGRNVYIAPGTTQVSELGNEFLKFISDPPNPE